MKLRNKKTGEIVERVDISIRKVGVVFNNDETYDTLAKLNEEWEDYEDDDLSKIIECLDEGLEDEILPVSANDFVEKLKAWKRVKDKDISFEVKVIDRKWYLAPKAEPEQRTFDEAHDVFKDIMFIFGGEE